MSTAKSKTKSATKKRAASSPAKSRTKTAAPEKSASKSRAKHSEAKTPALAAHTKCAAPATCASAKAIVGLRVRMGDAMRLFGVDEPKLAEKFSLLLDVLGGKRVANAKLLLEVLKECVKHLEPPVAARTLGGIAPNVPVQLVTVAPRPDRAASPGASLDDPSSQPPSADDPAASSDTDPALADPGT